MIQKDRHPQQTVKVKASLTVSPIGNAPWLRHKGRMVSTQDF